MKCSSGELAHRRLWMIKYNFGQPAHQMPQIDLVVKELQCKHVDKNVLYSQLEPAEQCGILIFLISLALNLIFYFKILISRGPPGGPYIRRIYIYISLLC